MPPPSSHALHSNVSNWIASDSSGCSAYAPTFSNATSLNITASCHYLFKTRRTKYQINGELYRESSIFITFFYDSLSFNLFPCNGASRRCLPRAASYPGTRLIITKSPSFYLYLINFYVDCKACLINSRRRKFCLNDFALNLFGSLSRPCDDSNDGLSRKVS